MAEGPKRGKCYGRIPGAGGKTQNLIFCYFSEEEIPSDI